MASKHQILCIKKSDRMNPHERIIQIGGLNHDGSRWRLTQSDAIVGIETGKWEFYVSVGGATANVIVAISAYGNKYIKTISDGLHPDNLLSLPECP